MEQNFELMESFIASGINLQAFTTINKLTYQTTLTTLTKTAEFLKSQLPGVFEKIIPEGEISSRSIRRNGSGFVQLIDLFKNRIGELKSPDLEPEFFHIELPILQICYHKKANELVFAHKAWTLPCWPVKGNFFNIYDFAADVMNEKVESEYGVHDREVIFISYERLRDTNSDQPVIAYTAHVIDPKIPESNV